MIVKIKSQTRLITDSSKICFANYFGSIACLNHTPEPATTTEEQTFIEIQSVHDSPKIGHLANRLCSDVLEQWVGYEAEGYPAEVDVPEYRTIEISYKGHFSRPFGSGLKNAPIPN